MASTGPEPLEEKLSIEEDANDEVVIKVNLNVKMDEEDEYEATPL